MLGEEHPDTLTAMSNLALTLQAQGDLRRRAGAATSRCSRSAAACWARSTRTRSPSMNNLARTLRAQGDLAGARALQERVLEVRRRVLGEEHPDTLSVDEQPRGDAAGAGRPARRAGAAGAGAGGQPPRAGRGAPGHADVDEQPRATRCGRRATWRARGRCRSRCWRSSRRVLGDEHPDTLTSMSNLAETLRAQGDLAGARALQERGAGGRRRVLGEEHPDTLTR